MRSFWRWLKRLQPFTVIGLPLVLAAAFVIYLPTLDDHFHGDDYVAFTEFKTRSFLDYAEAVLLFEDVNFYWRPLGKLFHRSLYEVAGLDPVVFRVAALTIFLATIAGI